MIGRATGFACTVDGEIVMRSVSDTRRAAKVNALVVVFRVPVYGNASDAEIEAAWAAHVAKETRFRVEVVPVRVVTA